MARYSKLGLQMLGLLSTGLLLGYARGKRNRKKLLDDCDKIWHSIDRDQLFKILHTLKLKKFIQVVKKNDLENVTLTSSGKYRARQYLIDKIEITKSKKWDG